MRLVLWYLTLGSFAVSCTACGIAGVALGLTGVGVGLIAAGVFCAISAVATFLYHQPRRRVQSVERQFVDV